MNKCYKLMFLFSCVISFLPVSAQDEVALNSSNFFEAPLIGRKYLKPPSGKGSVYLYDTWLNGYVVYLSGDTVSNKLFKFDCYKNEFLWMSDGVSIISLDHNLIKSFALLPPTGPLRVFEKTSLKLPLISDTLVRYLEVLSEGKMKLYAFRRITVSNESTIGENGGLYQVNVYDPEPVYFVQIDNLPVKQVRFNKKSLTHSYSEFAQPLKKILREKHSGGIRNEFQLISAVKLINDNWK